MTIQFSVGARNNRLDSIETTVGTAPQLILYSGSVPANCAAADPTGVLATITLPSDWMTNAASGSKTINNGPWTGIGSASGTAASFRIKDSTGTTCHIQGTAGMSGTDMILDNSNIALGQTINVNTFTLTDGNA